MIKHTIYIGNPSYLKLKQQQLVVQDPETKAKKGTIPIEDIALLNILKIRLNHLGHIVQVGEY